MHKLKRMYLLLTALVMTIPAFAFPSATIRSAQVVGDRSEVPVKFLENLKLNRSIADLGQPFVTTDGVLDCSGLNDQLLASSTRTSGANVSDLSGEYVSFYTGYTLAVSNGTYIYGYNGGSALKVIAGEGNKVTLENFYQTGIKISAEVNIEAGTFTIPSQHIMDYQDFPFSIANFEMDMEAKKLVVKRESDLIGRITEDGSWILDANWGIFCDDKNTYVDESQREYTLYNVILYGYSGLRMDRGNAVMSTTEKDVNTGAVITNEFPIIAQQIAADTISVRNFNNMGLTIKMALNRNKSVTIYSQMAYETYGSQWKTIGNINISDGILVGYSYTILSQPATDLRTITWKDWSLLSNNYYYHGNLEESKVTVPFDISYPESPVTKLEGEGTETSPYLIKNVHDYMFLSDECNLSANYDIMDGNVKICRPYTGKYIRLDADLDLSGVYVEALGRDYFHQFNGTFDGNGHTISNAIINSTGSGYAGIFGFAASNSAIKNLTIKNVEIGGEGSYLGGIAGVALGTINDCQVIDSYVVSRGVYTGGIAGYGNNITACKVNNTNILGTGGQTGGIVGYAYGNVDKTEVTNSVVVGGVTANREYYGLGGIVGFLPEGRSVTVSSFSGNITTANNACEVGGIVGSCYGSIDRCFFVGTISSRSKDNSAGGVAGYLTGKITNCYSVGEVDGFPWPNYNNKVGGITGRIGAPQTGNAEVTNCYTTAMVYSYYGKNPEDYQWGETLGVIVDGAKPVLENIWFNNQYLTGTTGVEHGASIATLTSAEGLSGYDRNIWLFTKNQYPRLKGLETGDNADLSSSAIILDGASTLGRVTGPAAITLLGNVKLTFKTGKEYKETGEFVSVVDGVLTPSGLYGLDTICMAVGEKTRYLLPIRMCPLPFEGEGTEENPFRLSTKGDMINLSKATNNAKQQFPDTYFLMTNDIDLEGSTEFAGFCADTEYNNQFRSTFDGGGYTLSGVVLTNTVAGVDGFGLIGRLNEGGLVKNLTLSADCRISGLQTVGAIVGNCKGSIENCRNYGTVIGTKEAVGGIAGKLTAAKHIKDCFNGGTVTGQRQVGGIVGYINSNGEVESCANVGSVTATGDAVGGIVGFAYGSSLKNVANYGSVKSGTGTIGGLIGNLPGTVNVKMAIEGGLAAGTVQSAKRVSSIGGVGGSKGYAEPSPATGMYWDNQLLPYSGIPERSVEGVVGMSTSDLLSGKLPEGLDAEVWMAEAGKYPVLKQFAADDYMKNMNQIIVIFDDKDNVNSMSGSAALASVDGLVWSLADGKSFKINNNKLIAPEKVATDVISDTLIATYGAVSKSYPLEIIPGLGLAGNGTEQSPYLIASVDDWNILGKYMTDYLSTFKDSYFKIAVDTIDFAGKDFVALATGDASFCGTLDGNGAILANINVTAPTNYYGAICTVGSTGIVRNLSVSGKITTAKTNTGALVGNLAGKMENCHNYAEIESTGNYVAGLVGYASTGAEFTDCVNHALITSSKKGVAGIVAQTQFGVNFKNCSNKGMLYVTYNSSDASVGGIVGEAGQGSFVNCTNDGYLNGFALKCSALGGIVGYAMATSDPAGLTYEFTNCHNNDTIVGCGYMGGIVGFLSSANTSKKIAVPVMHFNACSNNAIIYSWNNSTTTTGYIAGISAYYSPNSTYTDCSNNAMLYSYYGGYVAGIAAAQKATCGNDDNVRFERCVNNGEVHGLANIGGIVSRVVKNVTVSNCYNTGAVSGTTPVGGITAYLGENNATLANCYNIGSVSGNKIVGGISGDCSTSKNIVMSINNCWNVGDVTNSGTAKSATGTGGIAGKGSANFKNCYNMGTVSGAYYVGGLIGLTVKDLTTLERCYNAGNIVASISGEGANLVGHATDGSNSAWTSVNSMKDCVYVGGTTTFAYDDAKLALSKAELAVADMGEGWTSADDYSYPVIAAHADVAPAKLYSAQMIFAEGEDSTRVTKEFKVGTPANVVWSVDNTALSVDGNNVNFVQNYTGSVTLTATCGELSKSETINVSIVTTSIDEINSELADVVSMQYFTIDGLQVAKPDYADGNVYIVVVRYANGQTKAFKVVNR